LTLNLGKKHRYENNGKIFWHPDGLWNDWPGASMSSGYARVSPHEQNLALQPDALTHAGCHKSIVDRGSGTVAERPGRATIQELLRAGDTLRVWRLERLGRSSKDLIPWVSWLEHDGIGLKSRQEVIATPSPSGKLPFHIFAALAEFARQLIQERTPAGLRAARARGRGGGRPKALAASTRQRAVQLYQEKRLTVQESCAMRGISKPTLYAQTGPRHPLC
jgi:DNA invertase Pin-like site-specific DNA recombinase